MLSRSKSYWLEDFLIHKTKQINRIFLQDTIFKVNLSFFFLHVGLFPHTGSSLVDEWGLSLQEGICSKVQNDGGSIVYLYPLRIIFLHTASIRKVG